MDATVDEVLSICERWHRDAELALAKRVVRETTGQSVVERGEGWVVARNVASLPFPLWPREMIYIFAVERGLKGGAACTMMRHVVHAKVPEQPKQYVRGRMLIGGIHASPVSGGARRCRVTYVGQMDPGGSIPTSLVDYFVDDMAHMLGRMQKEIRPR